jgi:hypothetical protein
MAEELETEQPLRLPIKLEEKEKDLIALPEATQTKAQQAISLPEPEVVPQPLPLKEGELD